MRLTHQSTDGVLTLRTSTAGCSSPACSSATRTTPSISFRFDRAPQLDGRAVRAHEHGVSVRDPEARGICGGELDVAAGALEAELGHALDSRPEKSGV
jgi:hypothetical protein